MKSAKKIKRIIASVLCVITLITTMGGVIGNQMIKAEENGEGTTTFFKANLFDYDKDKINGATLNKVVGMLKEDGVQEIYSDDEWQRTENSSDIKESTFLQKYPAIIFTDGNWAGDTSATYYSNTYWDWGWRTITRNIQSSMYYSSSNPWNVCVYGNVTSGMVQKELVDGLPVFNAIVEDLFSVSKNENKDVYENADVEFVLENGYYVLDSSKYGYSYNKENDRVIRSSNNGGFWPFREYGGAVNYHFGLDLSVDFAMTEDGRYNDKDCVFEFSGDDDVWVFVDDTLAIDLGGIHNAEAAQIDFANQQVIYTYDGETEATVKSFTELGLSVNDNDVHNLKVFYLERGGVASNCKIKFNMPTINHNEDIKGDFTFVKEDSCSKAAVNGATFTIYSNEDCTEVISSTAVDGIATSDSEGKVTFNDLATGEYYIVETGIPVGYETTGVDKYKLVVAGNSKETLQYTFMAWNGLEWVIVGDTVSDTDNTAVVYNTPLGDDVIINKTAKLSDWNERTYNITLEATATKQTTDITENTVYSPVDVVLVLDASYSMYFPADLESYDRSDNKELDKTKTYYFVTENAQATVYKAFYENGGWHYRDASKDNGGAGSSGELSVSYYNGNGNKKKVTYSFGGTAIKQFYTSPSNGTATRFTQLKAAATSFVENLAGMSAVSELGIIWFNSETGKLLNGQMLTLTEENVATAKAAINDDKNVSGSLQSKLNSGTKQNLGMENAKTMIDGLSTDHDKYVVLLTDGCPTETFETVNNAINGNNGTATALKNKGVTVVSIGVDVNEEYMSTAVTLLKDTASNIGESEDKYCFITQSANLGEIFGNLSTVIRNETSKTQVQSGTVVDVVDRRFELASKNQEALAGAVITENEDGTTTITWNDAVLNGWTRTFAIKAKDNYVGGNAVATNGPDSRVIINEKEYPFEQPKVNVRINLEAGVTGDEIFLGQSLDKYFTNEQLNKLLRTVDRDYSDVTLVYSWEENKASVEGSLEEFQSYIKTLSPVDETEYKLHVNVIPNVKDSSSEALAAAESMKNTDVLYKATMKDAKDSDEIYSVDGKYVVTVITGEIDITKELKGDFLDGLSYSDSEKAAIAAKQTVVFTIYQYDENTSVTDIKSGNANIVNEFKITINSKDKDFTKKITGLSAGMYQVVEETEWSWKYNFKSMEEVCAKELFDDNTRDGIFYIGKVVESGNVVDYKSMSINVVNKINSTLKKIYSDTTNVLNVFK